MSEEIETLHNPFILDFLKPQKLHYIHAATHKKSTIAKGWPDFTVAIPNSGNRFVLIELKTKTGTLSADQKRCHASLRAAGIAVSVRTDLASAQRDVLEAIEGLPPASDALAVPEKRKMILGQWWIETPKGYVKSPDTTH